MSRTSFDSRGPFSADQIRTGDPYELSRGHAIQCLPTGGRGSKANADGAGVVGSDPDVDSVGVDAGFSPEPGTLRAPDVAVGVSDDPGWTEGVPPLAIEYVDRGQNFEDLRVKIADLLDNGTGWIWVVRLDGPRRVEVHRPGKPVRLAHPGDELTAPGVLRNPVPVEALYDRRAARRVILRNLLQREGYQDLDDVLDTGREQGLEEGRELGLEEGRELGRAEGISEALSALRTSLLDICDRRGLDLTEDLRDRVRSCKDLDTLRRWLTVAVTADSGEKIFG